MLLSRFENSVHRKPPSLTPPHDAILSLSEKEIKCHYYFLEAPRLVLAFFGSLVSVSLSSAARLFLFEPAPALLAEVVEVGVAAFEASPLTKVELTGVGA